MDRPNPDKESLLARGAQSELFDPASLPDDFWVQEEEPVDDKGNRTGPARYTAERFFSKRPEDYKLCVTFLAAGMGLLKVARLLRVHHETVAAVRDREVAQIDIQKEQIKRNLRLGIQVAAERLPETMAHLSPRDLPLATAILIDQLAKLDGEPSQRIEVTVKGLTHEAVIKNLTAFPEAIDVPATGSPAGEPAQKDLPAPTAPQQPASDAPSGDLAS